MKMIVRLIAVALFVVFFDFALKNTDEVVLHLFWNAQTKSPLILLLLAFLVLGVALGVLAMMGTVLRYRRDLQRTRKEVEQQNKATAEVTAARSQPVAPPATIEQVAL